MDNPAYYHFTNMVLFECVHSLYSMMEGFDWAAVNSKERLNEQMRLRYQRIRNCSKEWSFKTIKSIFKLPGNLPPSSGGSGSSSGSSGGGGSSNSSGFSLTKSKGVYIFLP
jgi:hypothetical protein